MTTGTAAEQAGAPDRRLVLTGYAGDGDSPAVETDVSHLGVGPVAALLGVPAAEFVECHPLRAPQARELGELLGTPLDWRKYDYFVEVERI